LTVLIYHIYTVFRKNTHFLAERNYVMFG